jgi:hypothetical protein
MLGQRLLPPPILLSNMMQLSLKIPGLVLLFLQTRPAQLAIAPSLPHSTNGCSPAGRLVATARSMLMPLGLHGFADFANYQLPERTRYHAITAIFGSRAQRDIGPGLCPAESQWHLRDGLRYVEPRCREGH